SIASSRWVSRRSWSASTAFFCSSADRSRRGIEDSSGSLVELLGEQPARSTADSSRLILGKFPRSSPPVSLGARCAMLVSQLLIASNPVLRSRLPDSEAIAGPLAHVRSRHYLWLR